MKLRTNFKSLEFRFHLRRLRNLFASVLMIAAFLQVIGVPRVNLDQGRPRVRLVRLERPVWVHAWDAAASVGAWIWKEMHS